MAAGNHDREAFIARWSKAEASERANAQLFLAELADLLDVPRPENSHVGGYSFEFPVRIPLGPDTFSDGRIDLYRRGWFVPQLRAEFMQDYRQFLECTKHEAGQRPRECRRSSLFIEDCRLRLG